MPPKYAQTLSHIANIDRNKRVRASIQTFENEHGWKREKCMFLCIFAFFIILLLEIRSP